MVYAKKALLKYCGNEKLVKTCQGIGQVRRSKKGSLFIDGLQQSLCAILQYDFIHNNVSSSTSSITSTDPLMVKLPGMMKGMSLSLYFSATRCLGSRTSVTFSLAASCRSSAGRGDSSDTGCTVHTHHEKIETFFLSYILLVLKGGPTFFIKRIL
jgi:hypothetical protein